MQRTKFALAGALAFAAMALPASAQLEEAGSLLLFPEFDNRHGVENVWTITNTSPDEDVVVEIIYIGLTENPAQPCPEFNRNILLTPNDTFSFLTRFHNPNQVQGYAYAFAKSATNGHPIKFDHLIGSSMKLDILFAISYSTNPVVFKAGDALAEGDATDLNSNGLKDFDGLEYEGVSDEIHIPRFKGQHHFISSRLILVGLTGGSRFDTTLDFLVYNDNEEVFSTEYTFRCWDNVKLVDISGIFTSHFLKNFTNHDPNELFGAPNIETGWMRIDGAVANSTTTSISDPAFIAVLVEGLSAFRAADLPYGQGVQTNGALLSRANNGE